MVETAFEYDLVCIGSGPAGQRAMPAGKTLRIEGSAAATVRWRADPQPTWTDTPTSDTQPGMHYADLPTAELVAGQRIDFAWLWPSAADREATSFSVTVAEST